MAYKEAVCYAFAMVALNAVNMMTANQFLLGCSHLGMKIRVSLCSLIYRKTLKLSQTAVRSAAVVNLISNDVNRFDLITILLHYMWSAPLITAVVGYFLWLETRWAGMIGIAVVFTILIVQCKQLCNDAYFSVLLLDMFCFTFSVYWETFFQIPVENGVKNRQKD